MSEMKKAIEHALGVLHIRLDNCTDETEKKKIMEAIVLGEIALMEHKGIPPNETGE